ncbi:MAG: hypothetical protein Q9214_007792 [Letrouitia sp. 1 TL-2023]
MPSGEPLIANRADSPPDEPPEDKPVWKGLHVSPQTLLIVSIIIIATVENSPHVSQNLNQQGLIVCGG